MFLFIYLFIYLFGAWIKKVKKGIYYYLFIIMGCVHACMGKEGNLSPGHRPPWIGVGVLYPVGVGIVLDRMG